MDGCITKVPCGGDKAGPSPVDRRKQGLKRFTATEADGVPLGLVSAGANRHDSPLLPAQSSQGPFVANRPAGAPAEASIRSANTCSMSVWAQWVRSASMVDSAVSVLKAWFPQAGSSSSRPGGGSRRIRRTTSRAATWWRVPAKAV